MYRSKYLDKIKTKATDPIKTSRRGFLAGAMAAPLAAPVMTKQFVDTPAAVDDDFGPIAFTASSYSGFPVTSTTTSMPDYFDFASSVGPARGIK
jgi:hypothetical protein